MTSRSKGNWLYTALNVFFIQGDNPPKTMVVSHPYTLPRTRTLVKHCKTVLQLFEGSTWVERFLEFTTTFHLSFSKWIHSLFFLGITILLENFLQLHGHSTKCRTTVAWIALALFLKFLFSDSQLNLEWFLWNSSQWWSADDLLRGTGARSFLVLTINLFLTLIIKISPPSAESWIWPFLVKDLTITSRFLENLWSAKKWMWMGLWFPMWTCPWVWK